MLPWSLHRAVMRGSPFPRGSSGGSDWPEPESRAGSHSQAPNARPAALPAATPHMLLGSSTALMSLRQVSCHVAVMVPSQSLPWVPLCGAALAPAALAAYWVFKVLQVHFQCRRDGRVWGEAGSCPLWDQAVGVAPGAVWGWLQGLHLQKGQERGAGGALWKVHMS